MGTHEDDVKAGRQAAPLSWLREWLRSGVLPAELPGDGLALVEAATEQGLAGLLHTEASRLRPDWPAPVLQRLRRRRLAQLCQCEMQLDLAGAVQRRLLADGLRSLPLKGAAVAEALYGPGERPMGDVDLLVLDDFAAALDRLLRDGWRVEDRADHAVSLRQAQTPVLLELHRAPASCPGLHRLDGGGIWRRSASATGRLVRLPGAEDLLVLLSVHAAFQHALGLRLVQYLDLQRLLREPPFAAAVALEIAGGAGAAPSVALALHATRLLLGPLHADVEAAFAPHLPTGLTAWLSARADDPLALLRPTPRDLVRVRWALARGRRSRLLWETAAGAASGGWRGRIVRGWRLGRRLLEPRAGQAP
ncbi:MAG TPA: nucleotidyltransferase family protein [Vicinamibacteria bacterium]|nr:nucleotidyltransferase family protein [Vicinamibacteria bacterium]